MDNLFVQLLCLLGIFLIPFIYAGLGYYLLRFGIRCRRDPEFLQKETTRRRFKDFTFLSAPLRYRRKPTEESDIRTIRYCIFYGYVFISIGLLALCFLLSRVVSALALYY
jgi:hypothetical protein